MNYRRGLQRVYAVLTVAWIAGLLFTLPADRLQFWTVSFDPDAFMASQKAQHGNVFDQIEAEQAARIPPPPEGYKIEDPAPIKLPPGAILATPPLASPSRLERASWLFGVLLLPPAFGYVAVFLVIPWIYRGFRPTKGTV